MTYTSVVTIAWVVVGTGAGTEVVGTGTDEAGLSGESMGVLDSGTGMVVIGTSGTVEVFGGTQCVQMVDVLVTKTVDIVDVVSIKVVLPLVTVLVTGHVDKVV